MRCINEALTKNILLIKPKQNKTKQGHSFSFVKQIQSMHKQTEAVHY
jgi:hypothetical protein